MKLHFWKFLCDRCRKVILPTDMNTPSSSLRAMQVAGEFFTRQSRKGRIHHYCSEECLNAHFHPGSGTPLRHPSY